MRGWSHWSSNVLSTSYCMHADVYLNETLLEFSGHIWREKAGNFWSCRVWEENSRKTARAFPIFFDGKTNFGRGFPFFTKWRECKISERRYWTSDGIFLRRPVLRKWHKWGEWQTAVYRKVKSEFSESRRNIAILFKAGLLNVSNNIFFYNLAAKSITQCLLQCLFVL